MPKVELSINVNYLPSWGAWEGIRELVQNGKDAELEFAAPLEVTYLNGTLRIENEGAAMDRNALLFGTTSKEGRADMIGKFGEGLKLGTLALVRQGHGVKIRTGSEVWTAEIGPSKEYKADVLFFDIVGGREDKKRVRVEIDNVNEQEWERLKTRFLFLQREKKNDRVATSYGDLLLDAKHVCMIFVKGIFVQHDPRLQYGYNFKDVEIDRDRKMISSYDQEHASRRIWAEAIERRPDLLDPFYDMVSTGEATDIASFAHGAYALSDGTKEKIAAKFTAQFGANAVPVMSLGDSIELEHYGKKGIVVAKTLGGMLADVLGTKEAVLARSRTEVTKTFSWNELDADERQNLLAAIALVEIVRPDVRLLDLVDVVTFRSPTLLGQYKDGRILLAQNKLHDGDETLATLVHEFAHAHGGDGEKGHVAAIEHLWRDIVKTLRGKLGAA